MQTEVDNEDGSVKEEVAGEVFNQDEDDETTEVVEDWTISCRLVRTPLGL
jgi:hypothetical protein